MKKYIMGFAVILLITGTAFYKPIKEKMQDKPVDKNISFTIYKGANYTSKAYDCTYVQVHINVEKIRGNKHTLVWEKTFDEKELKQYPSLADAITQQINVPGVVEKKEHLQIKYVLTYNSRGTELQMQGASIVADSATIPALTAGSQISLVL
ncbi:MAG: hypothetical protein ABI861_08560 [Panacibacter sp.]